MEQQHRTEDREWMIKRYAALVAKLTPKSKLGQGCLRAYAVGGGICVFGQMIADCGERFLSLSSASSLTFASIVLIFFTALLTGVGVFDRIARFGGAGTVVPITGFANAMVSPAMEFKPEGWVFGTGARLFTIAGPVLVYGISASVLVGLLYYFFPW
ncbi:MAG: stage V sporulation protein AC [Clostridia bacterium]|nr:stage V sporulation protein AC [Clostridia bacterium]